MPRVQDWEERFDRWKFELKDVVDEYKKGYARRKRSNGSTNDDASSEKYSKQEEEGSSESTSKIAIDFKHMLSLDANSDMMSYIQEKSQYYTDALDKRCVLKKKIVKNNFEEFGN